MARSVPDPSPTLFEGGVWEQENTSSVDLQFIKLTICIYMLYMVCDIRTMSLSSQELAKNSSRVNSADDEKT